MKMDLTAPESNDPILKLVSSSSARSEKGFLISITARENDPVRGEVMFDLIGRRCRRQRMFRTRTNLRQILS